MNWLERLSTVAALGPLNVVRVAAYRLGLRTGLHPVLKLRADMPSGPFFSEPIGARPGNPPISDAWLTESRYFGRHAFPVNGIPDWHANPFQRGARVDATSHWSRIADFDSDVGDIKAIWEASRFDWLIAMAERAAAGDVSELERLNEWLENWVSANPPYSGANWKCGQEASIRVMHLALAAMLLGQFDRPSPGLADLVRVHLARIAPTVGYAVGQQNNHGTSEGAALYIGGSWLESIGDHDGQRYQDAGLHLLENRAKELIEEDGTFSQYSVVYHRLMLDTYCLAEVWRRRLGLPAFSSQLTARLGAASEWLRQMTDRANGDAPNLGANDGARLIPLTNTDFRDFRPSVQLASVLFLDACAFDTQGTWDLTLGWLGLEKPSLVLSAPSSASLDKGGFHILRRGTAVTYLRYPRFRFRPGQADALHVDLWVHGENVLRDAGSYSYNMSEEDLIYFNGTSSHNTVQLDRRDQMPRMGRFLFASWLKAEDVKRVTADGDFLTAAAGYHDRWGAAHHRQIWLAADRFVCRDRIFGNVESAVLRWRLMPGEWSLAGATVSNGRFRLSVSSDAAMRRVDLVEGAESRYYLEKTPLPVFEVELPVPATVETEIRY